MYRLFCQTLAVQFSFPDKEPDFSPFMPPIDRPNFNIPDVSSLSSEKNAREACVFASVAILHVLFDSPDTWLGMSHLKIFCYFCVAQPAEIGIPDIRGFQASQNQALRFQRFLDNQGWLFSANKSMFHWLTRINIFSRPFPQNFFEKLRAQPCSGSHGPDIFSCEGLSFSYIPCHKKRPSKL